MVRINNECYVSLEVAKLLKEAGFDWKCNGVFISEDGTQYTFIKMDAAWDSNNSKYNQYNISAPTIEVAQRWLREVKGCYVFAKPIFSANRKLLYYLSDVVYDKDYTLFAEFSTYERAQESGIKKALEIILEKGE